jgi:aryl-alcohol dehydrogenase-like predicted oxidoreductase
MAVLRLRGTAVLRTAPFGSTGHESTRLIFGAAALWNASQETADRTLELLLERGVNHIDAAASYGDAELRVAPWMQRHRDGFFLATKTGERGFSEARASIEASRERMQVDQIDLIQLHNLVKPEDWERALGPDGALRAAVEARDAGHVRFIGVTGHGTRVAEMHLRSLERFPFDSILLPYNPSMMASPEYAAEFEAVFTHAREHGVAVQTIKAIARRRWREGETPDRNTWYKPLESPEAIERVVHWALAREGAFVNTASDLDLLPHALDAGASFREAPSASALESDASEHAIEPLFVRGFAPAP